MPWTRKLVTPIKLKDGRTIATLGQARAVMLALPERHQSRPFWQYAAELLIDAAVSRRSRQRRRRGVAAQPGISSRGAALSSPRTKDPAAFRSDGVSRREGLGGCSHALAAITGSAGEVPGDQPKALVSRCRREPAIS
jgi:hypothetical protein